MKKEVDLCELSFNLGRIYNKARNVGYELDKFGKTLTEEQREFLDEIERMQDDVCHELAIANFMETVYEEGDNFGN